MQYFVEHSEVTGTMLPQIKRPGHDAGSAPGHASSGHDDGEVEIEVVDVRNVDGSNVSDDDPTMLASNAAFRSKSTQPSSSASAPPASLQPSHLKKGVFGDEPTQLMPVKKNAAMPQPDRTPPGSGNGSARPPASSARPASTRPGPNSGLPEARGPARSVRSNTLGQASERPSFRPSGSANASGGNSAMPKVPAYSPPPSFKMRDSEESQTSMRPLSALSDEAKKVLQESKLTAASMAVPSAGAIKAQVDAARAKRLSDQRQRAAETLEVTPVSISERFIVQGRPAAPWAIAFVAMGIFAGVTTAVFTGGRASAIAAFIDPAHEAPAAAAQPNAVAAMAPVANDPAANLLPGAQATPQPAVTGAPVDIAPMTPTVFAVGRASQTQQAAQPQPAQTQAPAAPTQVAQVAATPHVTPKADPPPAPRPPPVAASRPDPKPAPVAAAAADPKPTPDTNKSSSSSKHSKKPAAASGGGDVDSAAAADALAKAQLENSL